MSDFANILQPMICPLIQHMFIQVPYLTHTIAAGLFDEPLKVISDHRLM